METVEKPRPIERVETSPAEELDDSLMHCFCIPCRAKDMAASVKPRPYCGKQKKGDWKWALTSEIPPSEHCVVCISMIEDPCPRCGSMFGAGQ